MKKYQFIIFCYCFPLVTTTAQITTIAENIHESTFYLKSSHQEEGAFYLSLDSSKQELIIIPLSSDFIGIESVKLELIDGITCSTEFILPWHPDTRYEVPLPEDFWLCLKSKYTKVWRIKWQMASLSKQHSIISKL